MPDRRTSSRSKSRRQSRVPPVGYPSRLPKHGSLTVPWVARREAESPTGSIEIKWVPGLTPSGEATLAIHAPELHRCHMGFLWYPGHEDPLDGAPQFAQVDPGRHRACMDDLRCQVCSRPLTKPVSFLVDPVSSLSICKTPDDPILTTQPPVCARCIPLARSQCPHLRRSDWPEVKAMTVAQVAVNGDVFSPYDGQIEKQGLIKPVDDEVPRTLARQRVVALLQWHIPAS